MNSKNQPIVINQNNSSEPNQIITNNNKRHFKNLKQLCSSHIHIFDPSHFKIEKKIVNGKERVIVEVDEFEIKIGDTKMNAS